MNDLVLADRLAPDQTSPASPKSLHIQASPTPAAKPANPPQGNPLLAGPILPTLLRLALPNMASMFAVTLVAVAETSYVGALGTASLAGMALVFPMVMLQTMMSAGAMGGGISSAISRALGAGDDHKARALAVHATMIGLVLGLVFMTVFLSFGRDIHQALGGRGAALDQAALFSGTVFLGSVSVWLSNSFASILRGQGNMKIPSAALFAIAATEIALGGSLGLGLGPLPRLGMVGVAMGQVIAYTGGALFFFWYLRSGRARVSLRFRGVALSARMFWDILKVGLLACVSPLQTVIVALILTRLVAHFGTEALAGYGIGARLEFLLIPITFAIGVACVPMVGMAVGAGMVERARRVAWTGGSFAAAVLGTIGLVFMVMPDLWATRFTADPAVLASARTYLAWSGFGYAFFGMGLALYFSSQGAGKVLGPVLAGTSRLAVIALGGAALAAVDGPAWAMFAMVGLGMVVYGLATALAVRLTPWSRA